MKIKIGLRKDLSVIKDLDKMPFLTRGGELEDGYPFFISVLTPIGTLQFYRIQSKGKIPYYELRSKQ